MSELTHIVRLAEYGDDDAILALLEANPLAIHDRDEEYGWSALHRAAMFRFASTVEILRLHHRSFIDGRLIMNEYSDTQEISPLSPKARLSKWWLLLVGMGAITVVVYVVVNELSIHAAIKPMSLAVRTQEYRMKHGFWPSSPEAVDGSGYYDGYDLQISPKSKDSPDALLYISYSLMGRKHFRTFGVLGNVVYEKEGH